MEHAVLEHPTRAGSTASLHPPQHLWNILCCRRLEPARVSDEHAVRSEPAQRLLHIGQLLGSRAEQQLPNVCARNQHKDCSAAQQLPNMPFYATTASQENSAMSCSIDQSPHSSAAQHAQRPAASQAVACQGSDPPCLRMVWLVLGSHSGQPRSHSQACPENGPAHGLS
jgi:hypothetical protein